MNGQMKLSVTEGLEVTVIPDSDHEFLMTTKEVASGYGVSAYAIRQSYFRNQSEFIEKKHFIKGGDISLYPSKNAQPHKVFWTKRGIVRLGFFIKSNRARMFRDWAEELIIRLDEAKDLFGEVVPVPEKSKRRHNRLTRDRMVGILTDVAKIEDKELRLSLIEKLTNGR